MPLRRVLRHFQEFAKLHATGGILLFICAVAALVLANSPWAAAYHDLWQNRLRIGVGDYAIHKPLLLWINDGLMAIFFFLVGLEIKRELLAGELASPRQAALSIAAAAGGMIAPALLYLTMNAGTAGGPGWGIPIATDIAFALGVLTVLGSRAPAALKIFVTAMAIIDDLAAVAIIALFYTAQIHWQYAIAALLPLAALVFIGRIRHDAVITYVFFGLVLWVLTLLSGIHATIAGVLLAICIPMKTRALTEGDEGGLLVRMEHAVHPWVAFLILPLFAFANAGVTLAGGAGEGIGHPVALGIMLGLVLGKPLGVVIACWVAVRSGAAGLPAGVTWLQLGGAGLLAGIGFTMSLFIGGLAFADPELLNVAKIGILTASLISGIAGSAVLIVAGQLVKSESAGELA